MVTFFISYTEKDLEWARWITWTLDQAGHDTIFQERDFRPGQHFALLMHNALESSDALIAVLSENYLAGNFTYPEWAGAFATDPKGTERKLIPVRISRVKPTGLLKAVNYIDLVGVPEAQAAEKLRKGVQATRVILEKPPFPGATEAVERPPSKPVEAVDAKPALPEVEAAHRPSETALKAKPEFPGPHRPISDTALVWAILAGIGLLIFVLIREGDRFHAYHCSITIAVHTLLGLLSAVVLFGVLRSTGVMTGTAFGGRFEFGGAASVFIFFVLVGVYFCRAEVSNGAKNSVQPGLTDTSAMAEMPTVTDATAMTKPPVVDTTPTVPGTTTTNPVETPKRHLGADLLRIEELLEQRSLSDDEETELATIVLCLDQAQSKVGKERWSKIVADLEEKRPDSLDEFRKNNPQVSPCY